MLKKVIVAMSGGVDSSVAALLLKEQGYEVIGITMQVWPEVDSETGSCCGLEAVNDAKKVAWRLGIPHYVFNFREEFKAKVIDYFCREYLAGKTPNPCIACNRHLKFNLLLRKAMAMDVTFLATGNYARIVKDNREGRFRLLKGVDQHKDQSYVLYCLNQYQMEHTLFPLGTYTKPEVRKLAEDAGIPVSHKSESQDLCFVSTGRYGDFVEKYLGLESKPGVFQSNGGEILGRHRGIHHYTVGQRKGLGISLGYPAYVTGIDAEKNIVWIGKSQELETKNLQAEDFHYISGEPFRNPQKVTVKIRYSSPPIPALATPLGDGKMRIEFDFPKRAVTPGQAVVLYNEEEVLGGGTIVKK